jgi:hypothetical protein
MGDADRAAIDDVMDRFFRAVSFDPGGSPSYDDLHELFVDDGLLIRCSGDAPDIAGVADFVATRHRVLAEGSLTSFAERELAHATVLFGNVAQRFSHYAKQGTTADGGIDTRGAISTQLVCTEGRWRISSMAWDDERPGLDLPATDFTGRTGPRG